MITGGDNASRSMATPSPKSKLDSSSGNDMAPPYQVAHMIWLRKSFFMATPKAEAPTSNHEVDPLLLMLPVSS